MDITQADNVGPGEPRSPRDPPIPPEATPRPASVKPISPATVPFDDLEAINTALLKALSRDFASASLAFEAALKCLSDNNIHYPIESLGSPIYGAPDEGEHQFRIGWTNNEFTGAFDSPLYFYFAFYSDDVQQIQAHAEVVDEAGLADILEDEDAYDIPEDDDEEYEYTEVVDDPDQNDIPDEHVVPVIVSDTELE